MYLLIVSIFLANFHIFSCSYLEAEANYHKPKLERNNIVNRGVWIKNRSKEHLFEKTSLGNFVFRTSSVDDDRLPQTSFDTFARDDMDETPLVSSYVKRARRSPNQIRKRHTRKSLLIKNIKSSIEDSKSIHSKIISSLKPSSLYNEYPNEVAILLNNNGREFTKITKNGQNNTKDNDNKVATINIKGNGTDQNHTEPNLIQLKRSRKHNYDINNENLNVKDIINKTEETNEYSKINSNVFDKDDRVWHQNAPIPDTNMYVVVPKEEKTKGVTERGLIKLLSMLTKTFKKIMKQHGDIKIIYDKLNFINDDFLKQVNGMNVKFQDFDSKYSNMIQFNERLKTFEQKLIMEQDYLKSKHKNMEDRIVEFQNQQQKFLAQQKQFFYLQKVMLAEAENINVKQSMIAKTQSEISHRQNTFARIFKKTKQLLFDKKQSHHTDNENHLKVLNTIQNTQTITKTSTDTPSSTESIKLNLFSIPTKSKLGNQDKEILKEKDDKPIDDLVYKYYFNNSLIDSLMKSKFLKDYATNTNSIDIARNVQNKRDESDTTILLPISNNFKGNTNNRVRRWVSHIQSKKSEKPTSTKKEDMKILKTIPAFMLSDTKSNDPFRTMAKTFCNEIGQNKNDQTLKWCIEKSLRRLKYMDKKLFSKPVTVMQGKEAHSANGVPTKHTTDNSKVTMIPIEPSTVFLTTNVALAPTTPMYAVPNNDIFFPDNDELESNLKQFDLKPDTEGVVYYDGSAHLSDIGDFAQDRGGISDFMPGWEDEESRAEMDPTLPFDIEAKRRAYVIRMKQNMQRLKSRKL